MGAELFHADRRTDLIVNIRNFTNAPKDQSVNAVLGYNRCFFFLRSAQKRYNYCGITSIKCRYCSTDWTIRFLVSDTGKKFSLLQNTQTGSGTNTGSIQWETGFFPVDEAAGA